MFIKGSGRPGTSECFYGLYASVSLSCYEVFINDIIVQSEYEKIKELKSILESQQKTIDNLSELYNSLKEEHEILKNKVSPEPITDTISKLVARLDSLETENRVYRKTLLNL